MEDKESQAKMRGDNTIFNNYIFRIILAAICVLGGVLLEKYYLGKSPELTYSINKSPSVSTHGEQYFPVVFDIANTGDIPLEDVVLSAGFKDTIISAGAEPRLTRGGELLYFYPASYTKTLEQTFDLAVGERHSITIVAKGAFVKEQFLLKSNEVVGRLAEIEGKRGVGYVEIALLALVCAGILLAIKVRHNANRLYIEAKRLGVKVDQIDKEVERLKQEVKKADKEKKYIGKNVAEVDDQERRI